jgi:polysaccharide chain length determinant protein (PEP-CTERM system associated)
MEHLRVLVRRQASAAWRFRWAMVACTWIVCAIGWVAVTMIPNRYEASARLYVEADAVLTPLLRGLAVENQVGGQVDMLQRTLLSRPNLEKLIANTDLDLQISGSSDLEAMVQGLATAIKITPHTRNLFTIAYRHASPKLAFDVVQTVLTTFIESKTGANRSEMQNATLFLEQQIAAYERQLRDAERRRADFRAKYMDLLPSDMNGVTRLETATQMVRALQGALQDENTKRDMLRSEVAAVPPLLVTETDTQGTGTGTGPGAGSAQALLRGLTGPSKQKLDDAQARLEQLLLRYTPNHPDVVFTRREIDTLRANALREAEQLAREAAGASAAAAGDAPTPAAGSRSRSQPNPVYEQLKVRLVEAESALSSLQRQLSDATRERNRLEEIARGAPGLQAEFMNLNRDYDVLRKNYEELLSRRESMRIASAAEADADKIKIQIIDPPQVPQNAVEPKRALLTSGVLVAALALGVGLALLLAQFDQSFHTLDELRDLGLPVAGSISMVAVTSPSARIISVVSFTMAIVLLLGVYGGLLFRIARSGGPL